jgi:hypothetical protein
VQRRGIRETTLLLGVDVLARLGGRLAECSIWQKFSENIKATRTRLIFSRFRTKIGPFASLVRVYSMSRRNQFQTPHSQMASHPDYPGHLFPLGPCFDAFVRYIIATLNAIECAGAWGVSLYIELRTKVHTKQCIRSRTHRRPILVRLVLHRPPKGGSFP